MGKFYVFSKNWKIETKKSPIFHKTDFGYVTQPAGWGHGGMKFPGPGAGGLALTIFSEETAPFLRENDEKKKMEKMVNKI